MPYTLPPKPPRQYLPQKFNPLNPKDLKDILQKLLHFPPQDFTTAKQWFCTFHELSCAVSEAQTILELNVSLDNSDKNHEKKLEEFEKNILSQLLLCREKMMDIYLNSPFKYSMHAYDSGRIEKDLLARKKFSIAELSSLQIEENKIIRDYKKFTNLSSTQFQGQNILLSSIIGKTHDLNEKTRKEAFFSYWSFVKSNEQKYQTLFDRLLENRRQQASVVGCKSYTEIAFAELGRFDYGPTECAILRNSILKEVVPVITQLARKKALPWNSQMWPELMPKSSPANGSHQQLILSLHKIMTQIHPSFGNLFEDMKKKNLLDVFPRAGKSPGAFSVTFQESGCPFLFGNFGSNLRDIFTFIHEFGHCLHGYAVSSINNILTRHPGFEVCELASIGLELLATKFLHELWPSAEDAHNALRYQLFQMLQFWPFMAMIDEWQHSVYAAEKFLGAQERNELWLQLSQKYKPHLDWNECKDFEELGWLSRQHIYTSPFYFIDYGIAQIGAVQLWSHSKQNYSQTVEKYVRGLSLGAQLNLTDLYNEIGVKFDFSSEMLAKLCLDITQEITQ